MTCKRREIFGGNSAVRKVINTKTANAKKNGKSKSIIADMVDTIRNTLLRAANTISGRYGEKRDL